MFPTPTGRVCVLLAFDQCQGLITSSDHNYDRSWYVHTALAKRINENIKINTKNKNKYKIKSITEKISPKKKKLLSRIFLLNEIHARQESLRSGHLTIQKGMEPVSTMKRQRPLKLAQTSAERRVSSGPCLVATK